MNDRIEDELLRDARGLQKSAPPPRDLWPAIEAEISRPARTWFSPLVAQAAAVVLLVGASSGLTYLLVKDDGGATIAVQPEYVFNEASFGSSYSLGPGFTDARGGIAAKLDSQLEKLSPEDRAGIEENLALVRTAIQQINEELAQDPDNVRLQTLLLKTYREELMIMRRVSSLTQTVTTRNDM